MPLAPIRPAVFALCSGVALALSFPTFHWYPLAWVSLVPLLWAAGSETPRGAAKLFFVAGWAFHSVLLQWLATNIFWAGGWALLGQQGLCAALALFWAATGFLWRAAALRLPMLPPALTLPILWGAMEWGQANLLTGFGWSALGYSQGPDLSLAQLAALGGVSLVSMALVAFNALAAQIAGMPRHALWPAAAAMVLVAGAHGAGRLLLPELAPPALRVGLYQSNYPQEMKWDYAYLEDMVRRAADHSRLMAAAEKEASPELALLVWPEALVMRHYSDPRLWPWISELAQETGVPLFAGAVRESGQHSHNSSVLVDSSGREVAHYDKVHLAPYGEYVPFAEYLPFLDKLVPGGAVTPGDDQKVLDTGAHKFGPLICFEVLFAPMAEHLRAGGAEFLVVITNLSWFGRSNAIAQELEIARFRAIETRLPVVHSANTGISGVFDSAGRFTVLNGFIDSGGRYRRVEVADPMMTVQQRMAGAAPVPPPGRRPLPGGPVWIPRLTILLAGLLIVGAALRRTAPAA